MSTSEGWKGIKQFAGEKVIQCSTIKKVRI
jgi:hypothetical protein